MTAWPSCCATSPQLHLAIASRSDPPLPLAWLRAGGQLTELRAAELRFTPEEAAAFLQAVWKLDLSVQTVAALPADVHLAPFQGAGVGAGTPTARACLA
jgi:ATP/maltotriose-dependent transcriptional regulator MalT